MGVYCLSFVVGQKENKQTNGWLLFVVGHNNNHDNNGHNGCLCLLFVVGYNNSCWVPRLGPRGGRRPKFPVGAAKADDLI